MFDYVIELDRSKNISIFFVGLRNQQHPVCFPSSKGTFDQTTFLLFFSFKLLIELILDFKK